MRKAFKPYFTWAVVLLVCVISLYSHSKAESFYGLHTPSSLSLAFSGESPLAAYGLPWLSSAFLHQRIKHMLINLVFFVLVSYMLEKKFGSKVTFYFFICGHFITLFILSLLSATNTLQPALYLGLSHIIFAFLAIFAVHNKNRILLVSTLIVLAYSLLSKQNINQDLSHLLGFSVGLLSYFIFVKFKIISAQTF